MRSRSRQFSRYATMAVLCATTFATPAIAQEEFSTLRADDYPVSAEALPVYTTQIHLGAAASTANCRFVVDYPEYAPLSKTEERMLRQHDISALADTIVVNTSFGISQKEAVADISFVPFARRDGRWQRLVSFKLRAVSNSAIAAAPKHLQVIMPYAEAAVASERYAAHSVLASGKWVKIRVSEEGIHSLTAATLRSMGFTDPSRVKLFGYGGRLLPEEFTFDGDNALIDDLQEVPLYRDGAERLLFFAEGTVRKTWNASRKKWTHKQNTFTNYSYYFLTEGDAPLSFPTIVSKKSTNEEATTAQAYTFIDKDEMNWFAGGRVFYEAHDLANSARNYKFTLAGKTSGSSAIVDWDVSAASTLQTTRATLTTAGETLSSLNVPTYSGATESARGYRASITTDKLAAGDCTMQVAVSPANPAHLNYISITFEQKLSADYLTNAFSPCKTGAAKLKIENANSNIKLWQIGTDAAPAAAEVASSLSGTTLSATVDDAMRRFVLVDLSKTYPSPERVGNVTVQDLHAHTAVDLTIIVPTGGKLTEQAERLGQLHATKQGLTYRIVTPEQIYNEFSSGTPDATAIRRYMKMLYDRAATAAEAPKYLLLFGDGVWDNRFITSELRGWNAADYLPVFELSDLDNNTSTYSIGTLHSYVTDDYYGMLDDTEGRSITSDKLDLGIGRLPCHDAATAKIMVDRIERYLNNDHPGAWKNQMFALGDNGDNNLHMSDAEAVCRQASTTAGEAFRVNKIYQDVYDRTTTGTATSFPQATKRLKDAMRNGSLIFNYNGHGDPVRISHYTLMKLSDVQENVSAAMPLWIYASCEITPYDEQLEDLGRAALYNEKGGAIAVMCAARSVYANYNRSLDVQFIKQLLSKDDTGMHKAMGEALRLAKVDLVTPDPSLNNQIKDATMNKLKYALLGDPAVPLMMPTAAISVDSINGSPISSTSRQLAAGEVVTFSGHIATSDGAPDESFTGTLTGSLFDREQTLTCKGFGNTGVSPLTYKDFTKKVFEGSVDVKNGRWALSLVVPRDISYTNDPGLLTLYAVNEARTLEASGSTRAFHLNGSDTSAAADTIGPKLYTYLNTPDFPNGGTVLSSATFYAAISDSTGISTTGLGIGHDIELVLDGDYANPTALNDYFTYDFGSYRQGTVVYPLTELTPGMHTLECRAWDVNENSTSSQLTFYVANGTTLPNYSLRATESPARTATSFIASFPASDAEHTATFEVFTTLGQKIWHTTVGIPAGSHFAETPWPLISYGGTRVPAGLYIFRAVIDGKEIDGQRLIVMPN